MDPLRFFDLDFPSFWEQSKALIAERRFVLAGKLVSKYYQSGEDWKKVEFPFPFPYFARVGDQEIYALHTARKLIPEWNTFPARPSLVEENQGVFLLAATAFGRITLRSCTEKNIPCREIRIEPNPNVPIEVLGYFRKQRSLFYQTDNGLQALAHASGLGGLVDLLEEASRLILLFFVPSWVRVIGIPSGSAQPTLETELVFRRLRSTQLTVLCTEDQLVDYLQRISATANLGSQPEIVKAILDAEFQPVNS